MGGDKFSRFKNRLEEIRANLLGDLKKTRQTNQDEEFSQMLADFSDDATRYKIKNGDYGVCAVCEESIPEARLDIVPFALHCVTCLEQVEKEKQLDRLIDDDGAPILPAPNE